MKRELFAAAAMFAISAQPADAFPPTAVPSPGYDRALAESRRAQRMTPPSMIVEPALQGMKRKPLHKPWHKSLRKRR